MYCCCLRGCLIVLVMKSDDDVHFRCLESGFDVVETIVEVMLDEEILSPTWIVGDHCNCILRSSSSYSCRAAAAVDIGGRRAANSLWYDVLQAHGHGRCRFASLNLVVSLRFGRSESAHLFSLGANT